MATNTGLDITTTRKNTDKQITRPERSEESEGQTVNDHGKKTDDEHGHGTNKRKDGERKESGRRGGEERDEGREKYDKELTVEVVVEGTEIVSMMDVLKEVKKECGEVLGCRVRGERLYEITMKNEEAKLKLMDGIRVKGVLIQAKDIVNNDMVVSFINLPVYLEDGKIISKLEEWGVRAISAIKRRKWPGTEIADGTRFLKVRFNEEVRSLPYSTKFETLRGTEYFRVIHDRQVRVCRLCIKPGHLFRECPEFKCFRCHKTGHYARECEEQRRTEQEEERRREDDGEGREDQTEERREVERAEESGRDGDGGDLERQGDMEEEEEEEEEGGGEKEGDGHSDGERELRRRYGAVEDISDVEGEDEVLMEMAGGAEEDLGDNGKKVGLTENEDSGIRNLRSTSRGVRREDAGGVSGQATVVAQRLSAKRKAAKEKEREERRGPRSGM